MVCDEMEKRDEREMMDKEGVKERKRARYELLKNSRVQIHNMVHKAMTLEYWNQNITCWQGRHNDEATSKNLQGAHQYYNKSLLGHCAWLKDVS